MTHSLSSEEFEQELQNCLLHFYDYAYLQDNSIVKLIVPNVNTANRTQQFRERITNAIERLRPPSSTPALAKGARIYNVLVMRYIEQADIDEITEQLAISRRQFYRELNRAVSSLANILWEETSTEDDVPEDVFTLQSEIASLRLHANRYVLTNLYELLQGAIKANTILAKNHGVTIKEVAQHPPVSVSIDRALLRQLIVIVLSNIIGQYEHKGSLEVDYVVDEEEVRFHFWLDETESVNHMMQKLEYGSNILTLLEALAGTLHAFADENHIQLVVSMRRSNVLIVDDNPDVVDLFRRLLDKTMYRILTTSDGTEINDLIERLSIDVIILDIMLPRIDGFEVLQMLKNNVATQHIPVIICSVLETEELALSLGADAVIAKPPTKSNLDSILQRLI